MNQRWYLGSDIVKKWRIEGFELFDFLKAGVQAFTFTGQKVVDRDPLLKKEFTLEYLEEEEWRRELLARGTDSTGTVIVKGLWHSTKRKKLERIDTDKIALREFEKLPKNKWTDPEGCKSISFKLSDDVIGRITAISEAMTFRYDAADVDEYFQNKEQNQNAGADSQGQVAIEPETFIRSLQISYLDNTEVKIQYNGIPKTVSCNSMGFRGSKGVAWKIFLEILEGTSVNPDLIYRLGPAQDRHRVRIKEYDQKLKLIEEINKKLVSFLAKEYNIKFPSGFKVYERIKTEGKGAYAFKFKIPAGKRSYRTVKESLNRLEVLIKSKRSTKAVFGLAYEAIDAGASANEVAKMLKDGGYTQVAGHMKEFSHIEPEINDHRNEDLDTDEENLDTYYED